MFIYSLLVGGRGDTDYTTEGETVALIGEVLRVQAPRAEVQEPTVGRTVDSRLPVAAAVTFAAYETSSRIPPIIASAEEGERRF